MGSLIYGRAAAFDIEDRTLAHLQAVIFDKLRREETFSLELRDGINWVSSWLSPSTSIAFIYKDHTYPSLNRAWIESMVSEAGVDGTLRVTPEADPGVE